MQARRSDRQDFDRDYVHFDDEEDWEQSVRLPAHNGGHTLCVFPPQHQLHQPVPSRWARITPAWCCLPACLQGTTIQPGVGPILSTTLRGLSAITDRLTGVALQLAPADASPAVVRVAVSAGLVLLALSFVKSLLSVSCGAGPAHSSRRHSIASSLSTLLSARQ